MIPMNTRLASRPAAERASSPADRDALDARLAALSARRPAGPATSSATSSANSSTRSSVAPTTRTGGRTKRRHAAQGSRIASLGISLASTGALAAFFAMSNAGTGTQVQAASIVAGPTVVGNTTPITATAATPTPVTVDLAVPPVATQTASTLPAATLAATTVPATTQAPVAPVAQTVVQGGVFTNKWGDVQVQATFAADGSLVDVITLETPWRDGKSVRINDRAVPVLNEEALTIQSANVDTISGATYTSNDYRRSLQSAIDVAREAGLTTLA